MNNVEYTEEYAKGFVAGQTETLNELLYRVRSECSFGIITFSYLENTITQMINKARGD